MNDYKANILESSINSGLLKETPINQMLRHEKDKTMENTKPNLHDIKTFESLGIDWTTASEIVNTLLNNKTKITGIILESQEETGLIGFIDKGKKTFISRKEYAHLFDFKMPTQSLPNIYH